MPLGLIHATSRNMLKDRVSALREANIYEPQRYRHLVSSIKIVEEHGDTLDLVANFLVVRTMQEGEMTLFAAGRYLDQVRRRTAAGNSPARTSSSTAARSIRCWQSRCNGGVRLQSLIAKLPG